MTENSTAEHILLRPGIDRISEMLADRQRRLILLLLKQEAVETQADLLFRSAGEKEKVEISLVHNHLPRLEEAGYIEWDRETGEVSKGPRFDEVEPLLELIENYADELPPDWP